MMMTFNDFVHKYGLRNKPTANIKIFELLKKIGLDSKVGIYLRDGNFSSNYGIVNLHPSKGSHSICFIKDYYFDSYGCPLPKTLPNFIKNMYRK